MKIHLYAACLILALAAFGAACRDEQGAGHFEQAAEKAEARSERPIPEPGVEALNEVVEDVQNAAHTYAETGEEARKRGEGEVEASDDASGALPEAGKEASQESR